MSNIKLLTQNMLSLKPKKCDIKPKNVQKSCVRPTQTDKTYSFIADSCILSHHKTMAYFCVCNIFVTSFVQYSLCQ